MKSKKIFAKSGIYWYRRHFKYTKTLLRSCPYFLLSCAALFLLLANHSLKFKKNDYRMPSILPIFQKLKSHFRELANSAGNFVFVVTGFGPLSWRTPGRRCPNFDDVPTVIDPSADLAPSKHSLIGGNISSREVTRQFLFFHWLESHLHDLIMTLS